MILVNVCCLTLGIRSDHAYEKLGNYEKFMHGEAVCCGMYSILRIGEQHGLTPPGLAARMRKMLEGQGMLWDAGPVPEEALIQALAFDKKGSGGTIRPVFCREVGEEAITRRLHGMSLCAGCWHGMKCLKWHRIRQIRCRFPNRTVQFFPLFLSEN